MGMLNLDQMLDGDLASVEAAPNYITPENSVCILVVQDAKAEKKTRTNPKPDQEKEYAVLKLTYGIERVIEQAEGTLPMQPGSLFSDQYQFTEVGLPHFKARAQAIAAANGEDPEEVGAAKVGQILAALPGMRFKAAIKKVPARQNGVVIEGQFNVRLEGIGAAE